MSSRAVPLLRQIGDKTNAWFNLFRFDLLFGPLPPNTYASVDQINQLIETESGDQLDTLNQASDFLQAGSGVYPDPTTAADGVRSLADSLATIALPTQCWAPLSLTPSPPDIQGQANTFGPLITSLIQVCNDATIHMEPAATPQTNLAQAAALADTTTGPFADGGTGFAGATPGLRAMIIAKAGVSPNWPAYGGTDPNTDSVADLLSYLNNVVN